MLVGVAVTTSTTGVLVNVGVERSGVSVGVGVAEAAPGGGTSLKMSSTVRVCCVVTGPDAPLTITS